jgi:hypothetical protein
MISAHDDSERINIAKVRVLRSIDSHSEHVRMLGPLDGIANANGMMRQKWLMASMMLAVVLTAMRASSSRLLTICASSASP